MREIRTSGSVEGRKRAISSVYPTEELLLEKPKWEKQAELKATQEILIDVAGDFHGPLSSSLQDKIKSIQSIENLRTLTRKVYKTQSLEEFTELVNRAAEN